MTEETQTPETQTAAPAEKPVTEQKKTEPAPEQQKSEAAAKAQEVGKKLTGFLGGLAEKAKNLDVKELAEKAKNIDVKELTEKAKQKVNEVKDMAAEINAGKADNAVAPREEISTDQIKDLTTKASAQMIEDVPAVVQAVLSDLTQEDKVTAQIKFGTAADPAYIALSAKNLYYFSKNSDQFLAEIYPVSSVYGFSLLPPRGETAGRLVVFTQNKELKLNVGSLESYAKALVLYRALQK